MMNKRFVDAKRGITGSSYGLLVGLIGIVALLAVTGTGQSVKSLFGDVGDTLLEVADAELSISPGGSSAMNITSGPLPALSNPVQFVVTNEGNSPTGTLSSSLTNTDNFTIEADDCDGAQLGPNSSCAVTVSATANANGPYSGNLRVGGGAKFVIASLSGTASGLDPALMAVDQGTVNSMDVAGPGSPATGSPVTLTFTNNGEVVTGVLSTGNSNSTNFAISSDNCNGATLNGGQSCTLQVTPQSSAGGNYTGNVSVGDGNTSASATLNGTASGFSLFTFTSHTFTTCGVTGRLGPSLSLCRSAYSTSWDEDPAHYTMTTQGIQLWTVPETGTYRIEARGAGSLSESNSRGRGALVRGDVNLTEGDQIKILVGQRGTLNGSYEGGSGGSFVTTSSNSPLIVAGGAGGWDRRYYGNYAALNGRAGSTTSHASNSSNACSTGYSATTAGNASTGSSNDGGGGGLTNNGGGTPYGFSFTNGGQGANSSADGGFGGGGGTSNDSGGGGGGYAGGPSCGENGNGAGGSSFNSGTNQINTTGAHSGLGQVTITKL
ncbi:MAG: hypothetical protein Alpg2KO_33030 [Alphaproteobacteria bacterium]